MNCCLLANNFNRSHFVIACKHQKTLLTCFYMNNVRIYFRNTVNCFTLTCSAVSIVTSTSYWYIISDYVAGLFCYKTLPVQCIIFADGNWPGFSAWFCTSLVKTTQSRCIGMQWILCNKIVRQFVTHLDSLWRLGQWCTGFSIDVKLRDIRSSKICTSLSTRLDIQA